MKSFNFFRFGWLFVKTGKSPIEVVLDQMVEEINHLITQQLVIAQAGWTPQGLSEVDKAQLEAVNAKMREKIDLGGEALRRHLEPWRNKSSNECKLEDHSKVRVAGVLWPMSKHY